MIDFNSRSPEESDQGGYFYLWTVKDFNSRSPEESDKWQEFEYTLQKNFNSRSPEESDYFDIIDNKKEVEFQFTLSWRERLDFLEYLILPILFQFTLSWRERLTF